jgi:hypothetical protein
MICWGHGRPSDKKRQAVDKADVNGLKAVANRPPEANFASTKSRDESDVDYGYHRMFLFLGESTARQKESQTKMLLGRPATVPEPVEERRAMRRFAMRLPALVKFSSDQEAQVSTETQNVSARGVLFYLDHKPEKGARIEVTMTFPRHVTLTDNVRVRFTAEVLRVESLPYDRTLVAALIEEYEFLRSQAAENFPTEGNSWSQ